MKPRPRIAFFIKRRCVWLIRFGWPFGLIWELADERVDRWHAAGR